MPASADEGAEERRLLNLALDHMLERQAHVMAVADRMRIAGAELCGGKVEPVLGVYAADQYTFREFYQSLDHIKPFIEAASTRFELDDKPSVLVVAPGLPADEAGLRVGDVITAVGGHEPRMRGDLQLTRQHIEDGVVRLEILREGLPVKVDVPVRMGCSLSSRYMFGTVINAFAVSFGSLTGVYFFGGLLDFFSDVDELAIIVGHEFAHLVRGHTAHLRTSKRYEAEADYLGVYFAARAGFDATKATAVWEAMARENPFASVEQGFYSHPMTAERALVLRAAMEEIASKRSQGAALAPEEGRFALLTPEVPEAEVEASRAALRAEALEIFRSQQKRVVEVSHRLAVAGAELCGDAISPVLGAIVGRREDFQRSRKKEVEAAFGTGDGVTVFAVATGSPAERAGLRPDDHLISLGGHDIRKSDQVFDRMRAARGPIVAGVGRGEERMNLEIPNLRGCAFGTLLFPDSGADTETHKNEKEMIVPTGLLHLVADDDELAIAISHQLGHQILGRFQSVEHEERADEVGLRIAAKAGFDISKAPAFWDRWTAEQFWKISAEMEGGYVPHGAMSRRAPMIRKTVAELSAATPP